MNYDDVYLIGIREKKIVFNILTDAVTEVYYTMLSDVQYYYQSNNNESDKWWFSIGVVSFIIDHFIYYWHKNQQ